jgi:UDP-N-acetylmuramoylalanine--D-glutamate ligase
LVVAVDHARFGRRRFVEDSLMVESGKQAVLIVGCGLSGLAAARLHLRRGDPRQLWLHDQDEAALEAAVSQGFEAWPGNAVDVAFAVWSPGVPLAQDLARQLSEAGVQIISEVSFAAADLPGVVAVTGTNGKSTVCTLITEMLVAGGFKARSAGNVGTPASDMALCGEAIDLLVVELSSYQLELPLELDLKAALITNLASDHLDRYPSVDDYYRVKWSLFGQMPAAAAAVLPYDLAVVDSLPQRAAIAGRVLADYMNEVESWPRSDALAGASGLENLAQAVAIAADFDIDFTTLREVAATFMGLPHRAQDLGEFQGLTFVNDSKATNVAAAIASVERVQGALVVLLGGSGKGEDYHQLADCLLRRGATAICFGEEGPALAAATGAAQVSDLAQAVAQARLSLVSGGTVLLAPACASFDAYASYAARGEHFAHLARQSVSE